MTDILRSARAAATHVSTAQDRIMRVLMALADHPRQNLDAIQELLEANAGLSRALLSLDAERFSERAAGQVAATVAIGKKLRGSDLGVRGLRVVPDDGGDAA